MSCLTRSAPLSLLIATSRPYDMDSYQDLAAFVATQTAVIPGLLGFSAAARHSLKVCRRSSLGPRLV